MLVNSLESSSDDGTIPMLEVDIKGAFGFRIPASLGDSPVNAIKIRKPGAKNNKVLL
jgi:hypothetical protein